MPPPDAWRYTVTLIDAIPAAWPDLGGRIEAAFAAVPEKTKTYFRRRGLWRVDAEDHDRGPWPRAH
jgi:hypothetical protein